MSKNIFTVISRMKGVHYLAPATNGAIERAETALGLKFAEEYKKYLGEYGAISGVGFEFTGVHSSPRIDVVEITKRERDFNNLIPANMYVIESTGFEGLVILQDEKGYIYEVVPGLQPCKTFDSLADYLQNFYGDGA